MDFGLQLHMLSHRIGLWTKTNSTTLYLEPSTFFVVDTMRYSSSLSILVLPFEALGVGLVPKQREALERLDLLGAPPEANARV